MYDSKNRRDNGDCLQQTSAGPHVPILPRAAGNEALRSRRGPRGPGAGRKHSHLRCSDLRILLDLGRREHRLLPASRGHARIAGVAAASRGATLAASFACGPGESRLHARPRQAALPVSGMRASDPDLPDAEQEEDADRCGHLSASLGDVRERESRAAAEIHRAPRSRCQTGESILSFRAAKFKSRIDFGGAA
jgi:hypothetical protein